MATPPTPPGKLRRILRIIAWNALLLTIGLLLVGGAAEVYFRITIPFISQNRPFHFVPEVGYLEQPNSEVRYTNGLDFWTTSRTNSLGFLDRDPITPERAAASCHVAIIGDSFVKAVQVPIESKVQVRLEQMAARKLTDLDITTSAFGIAGTAQVHQLPLYDKYAKPLQPKLLILSFHNSDLHGSSPAITALRRAWAPGLAPYNSAIRATDGTIVSRPPHPEWESYLISRSVSWPLAHAFIQTAKKYSYLAYWMERKAFSAGPQWYADWAYRNRFGEPTTAEAASEAIHFTVFALNEFKQRSERDGISLAIIYANNPNSPEGKQLSDIASALNIPVISLHDYIVRSGGSVRESTWPHDAHWSEQGHQWAAEALLEYLEHKQEICAPAP